jgi:hypothetical protein
MFSKIIPAHDHNHQKFLMDGLIHKMPIQYLWPDETRGLYIHISHPAFYGPAAYCEVPAND